MPDYTSHRITMVDTQVRPHDVTKFPVIDAMLTVPRDAFVPDAAQQIAYVEGLVDLGSGRHLLDARAIGKMLDALDITPQHVVLELGCGMGYTTALLAHLAQAVVAIEENTDLANEAEAALATQGIDNAAVIEGAIIDGNAKNGPYDIVVAFGAVAEIPDTILDQLKEGGRIMAIFMDGALGEARLGRKVDGRVSWRMEFNATAPLLPGFEPAPSFVF